MSTAVQPRSRTARPQFPPHSPLRRELSRRVEEYFATHGFDEKGGARTLLKAGIIFSWALASYVLLVFFATSFWTAAPLVVSLGLAIAGIGFSVMHDGGHGAASRSPWVNRLLAASNDLLGASSYFWNQKHNIIHHTYTNVDGLDEDIDSSPFLRLSPTQPRAWYHRFQHFYVLPLLTFFSPKWALFDDWKTWVTARIAGSSIPRPRGWDAVQLVLGKLVFYGWSIALPLAFHDWKTVAIAWFAVGAVLGITLATIFQLAHVVEGTIFRPTPTEDRIELPFFEHQLATTSDFAPRNPIVTWYVGGLNYQVEHHLFPRIAHRHYPAISEIVRDVCREHGVAYHRHETFRAAVASHVRFLRHLGQPVAA